MLLVNVELGGREEENLSLQTRDGSVGVEILKCHVGVWSVARETARYNVRKHFCHCTIFHGCHISTGVRAEARRNTFGSDESREEDGRSFLGYCHRFWQ